MKTTPTAVVAGMCFVAATALAQPKEPITKGDCRPGPRCARGDVLSKGQCCEGTGPDLEKKPMRTRNAAQPVSPIEGFALPNIHVFEQGELATTCAVDRKRSALSMKTRVLSAKRGDVYGGCCFEHTEALPMSSDATAAASLYISNAEQQVQITLEESSGISKSYLHNGRLAAGWHQLTSEMLDVPEVRRLCVAVFGSVEAVPHDTWVVVKRVTFDRAAHAQR